MNILQINSSVRGAASASTRLASSIVARLRALEPNATLTVRETGNQPILDEAALGAIFTPADARTPEQAARAAIDDATIAEVQAADAIVIGVPAQSAQTFWSFMNPVRNTLRPHSGQGCGVRIA